MTRLELLLGIATWAHWTPSRQKFLRWTKAALPKRTAPMVLSIRVVGNALSRRLNGAHRGNPTPTNVLSFAGSGHLPNGHHMLGDLVICAPVVAREARTQGKELEAHWAHMTVHGVLHLLGEDHVKAAQALKMEAREIQILDRLGFSNPYV